MMNKGSQPENESKFNRIPLNLCFKLCAPLKLAQLVVSQVATQSLWDSTVDSLKAVKCWSLVVNKYCWVLNLMTQRSEHTEKSMWPLTLLTFPLALSRYKVTILTLVACQQRVIQSDSSSSYLSVSKPLLNGSGYSRHTVVDTVFCLLFLTEVDNYGWVRQSVCKCKLPISSSTYGKLQATWRS